MADRPLDDLEVGFRPLAEADLPLVHRWQHQPHVRRWWGDPEPTFEAMAEEYRPRIQGTDPVRMVLILVGGEPVGWIAWYRVAEVDDYAAGHDVPPGTVALDLAIGDPALVGGGLGRRVIRDFVDQVFAAAAPDAPEAWIDPNPDNGRAVAAYRAAGFEDTGIDLPDPEDPTARRRLFRLPLFGRSGSPEPTGTPDPGRG